MQILLVEDDLTAARGVSLMLKSSDAVVDHTETGEEALELARHYEYNIVLLDLLLPDIEGYDVLRRMRLARNNTLVLILSGLARMAATVDAAPAYPSDRLRLSRGSQDDIALTQTVNRNGTVWVDMWVPAAKQLTVGAVVMACWISSLTPGRKEGLAAYCALPTEKVLSGFRPERSSVRKTGCGTE